MVAPNARVLDAPPRDALEDAQDDDLGHQRSPFDVPASASRMDTTPVRPKILNFLVVAYNAI